MALAWNLAKVSTRGLIARGALTETAVPEDAGDICRARDSRVQGPARRVGGD